MKREKQSPEKVATARSKAPGAVKQATPRQAPTRQRRAKIPALLFEGDVSPPPVMSGPGQRYVLGPTAPPEPLGRPEEPSELPAAYGTKRLLLAARDPHWLYAHWDLTREQLGEYNAASADGHLIVRVHVESFSDQPCAVAHVHPESLHWFVHVDRGGVQYVAELGYFDAQGQWATVSRSSPTQTPPDTISDDVTARFETIPASMPFEQLLEMVKAAVSEDVPLAEALQQLRALGFADLPQPEPVGPDKWTDAQERALAEVVGLDEVRRDWIGSLEVAELIRRRLGPRVSSEALAPAAQAGLWSGAGLGVTSPGAAAERPRGFWLNLNADLIIYGATEPDAKVSIAGHRIRLRPDGTFSCRFAFPDGKYELPVIAVATAGDDARLAELEFSRCTEHTGEVGVVAQEPTLKAPSAVGAV
jgi:hypothetical protein